LDGAVSSGVMNPLSYAQDCALSRGSGPRRSCSE
jgi:hypothetical protein